MEALEADYSKRIHFSLHFLGFIIQASCENAAVKNGWLVPSIPHSLCLLSWQSGSRLWLQRLRYNFTIHSLIGWKLAFLARRGVVRRRGSDCVPAIYRRRKAARSQGRPRPRPAIKCASKRERARASESRLASGDSQSHSTVLSAIVMDGIARTSATKQTTLPICKKKVHDALPHA